MCIFIFLQTHPEKYQHDSDCGLFCIQLFCNATVLTDYICNYLIYKVQDIHIEKQKNYMNKTLVIMHSLQTYYIYLFTMILVNLYGQIMYFECEIFENNCMIYVIPIMFLYYTYGNIGQT